MGSKIRNRGHGAMGGGQAPGGEVERLIEKGRFKDAVKQAKLCRRAEATPESHRLLERAYLLRADQLRRGAMPAAAREVAGHLLEFGVTDPALFGETVHLLLSLGMKQEAQVLSGGIDSPEVRDGFAGHEADQAVVDLGRTGGSSQETSQETREIREFGQAIRMAIAAVQAGDEAKGLEALRGISRGSPFADWKFFVRGLAARLRGAESEVRANWDRLDPKRAAARVARTVRDFTDHRTLGRDGAVAPAVKTDALERLVFGAVVLEPLEELRALVASERFGDAIRRMTSLQGPLASIDPDLAVRLTRAFYDRLVKEARMLDYDEAMTLARQFTRAAHPLPIDPSWNRFWALLWEGPDGSLEEAEDYWRKYLKDLENLPILKADEQALGRALVLKHLGDERVLESDAIPDSIHGLFTGSSDKKEADQHRRRAIKFFEESLALAPEHHPTYACLMGAYEDWERLDDAAVVARRLLARFPDDFDALMYLAGYHFDRQEPEPALECVRRARAIKPLDEGAAERECAIHILRARDLALKERWIEGRAEFVEAERLKPETRQWLHVRARRAIFELKAGQAETAQELITDACADLREPTPLWLALLIESIRYRLPQRERDQFEARWLKAVPGKARSETAGALADLMASFVSEKVDYPGRAGHIHQVVGYLRRATRIKYAHDDLAHVCLLLSALPDQVLLLGKMVNRGIKLFPDSPLFLMRAAAQELADMKGGQKGAGTAEARLRKAQQLAEATNTPENARILPVVREMLSLLEDTRSGLPGLPFAGFGGGPFGPGAGINGIEDLLDFFSEMMGGGPFDDEGFDDEPAPRRTRPKGAPRPGKAKPR